MGKVYLLNKHTIYILKVRFGEYYLYFQIQKIVCNFFIIIYISKYLSKHFFDYFSFNSNFPNSHQTGCERVTVMPPPLKHHNMCHQNSHSKNSRKEIGEKLSVFSATAIQKLWKILSLKFENRFQPIWFHCSESNKNQILQFYFCTFRLPGAQ